MKLFQAILPSRNSRVVQLPTLLVSPPVTTAVQLRTLRSHIRHVGVQALIQAIETEASYHQAMAVAQPTATTLEQTWHAGAASSLLRVLAVVAEATQENDG